MAVILFFGRFSDLMPRIEVILPARVTDKASLTEFLSEEIEGFAVIAQLPDTRISVNMMVSAHEVPVGDGDEIAYMSALSGG